MPQPVLDDLRAVGGSLYGHVFENPRMGVPRGLYWSLTVEFAPLVVDGEKQKTSLGCEWMVWPVRRWPELDGMTLSAVVVPELVEASFYCAGHQEVTPTAISLQRSTGARFDARMDVSGDINLPGDTILDDAKIRAQASVTFEGIYVVAANLSPTPNTPELAMAAMEPFLSSADFHEPRWDEFKYVFEPRAEIA